MVPSRLTSCGSVGSNSSQTGHRWSFQESCHLPIRCIPQTEKPENPRRWYMLDLRPSEVATI